MALVFIINCSAIILSVLIHYEVLHRLSIILPKLRIATRFRIIVGVLGALGAHIAEVWLFAGVYYIMSKYKSFGELTGNFSGELFDCVYYSFVTYTSLGLGDIIPVGHFRFLTGIEALTGLVLIAWTASFLYMQMTRNHDA